MAAELAGQPVLILKEGTSRTRGHEAQHANVVAARVIAESVRSSLGPKGMDKMLVDSFGDVTITSDGATILKEMEVQHPAAKMMVEIAKTQDNEVGDGTTSVVVFAGDLLTKAEELIDKDVHPTLIIEGYRRAAEEALNVLDKIAIDVHPKDKNVLRKIAITSMASKLVSENKEHLADLAVDAIIQVSRDENGKWKADIDDILVVKKAGESLSDTNLVQGVVVDKEVVHPGMPKRIDEAKIALLDCPLEIEKTEFDAKLNIESPDQMKAFLDQEETMLRDMVKRVTGSGANVLICQKGIDDMVQHFLARNSVLSVRRVKKSDMEKLAKATGGRVVTDLDDLSGKDLGYAKLVEERKIADDKMTFVEGCKNPKAVTILIRGGTERIVDEAERSVHDALCVVRDVVQEPKIVAGGGAPESELAGAIRKFSEKISGREQLAIQKFAEALEGIPTALAENSGSDTIDTIVALRSRHEKGEVWAGLDPISGKVKDMEKLSVYEPLSVKKQVIKSASEAANMILRIDDIIASSKMKGPAMPKGPKPEMPSGEGGD